MPDNDTLLSYLVSSFPGNTENIATEALWHILNSSNASMEALNDVVRSGVREVKPITTVKTQVSSPDGTRPDLVGLDENDRERVLVEVKFRAGLAPTQPNGYLKRLPDDGPAVLVFLAPEERIQWLWPELRDRLKKYGDVTDIDSERKCVCVGNTQRHLMIVSWGSLLDSMAARTRDDGESGIETQIRQLRSLAKYAYTGAIKPISQDEKIGADSEDRIRLLKQLIDEATERGIEQGWVDRKGLRATPRSYGYGRYIRLLGAVVWFGVNLERFEETANSPLWVNSQYSFQPIATELAGKLDLQDSYWVPIVLKRGVEYPAMLDGVVDSLKRIADVIYETRSLSARDLQDSTHGEPLAPIIESPDGLLTFPDGTSGYRGNLTEKQQFSLDVFNACRLFGQTGDDSELVRLGILQGPE